MLKSHFQRIIAMNTLSGIGMSLIGIFTPIYFLHLNYPVSNVILYLVIQHTTILVGAFLVVYLSNIIGLVKCWYIRVVFVSLLLIGLLVLPKYPNILFLLAFINGLEAAFFWIPLNILMIRKTEEKSMGSSLALMSNVSSVFGIITPLISAFIIINFGYNLLFVLALMFVMFSILPILSFSNEKTAFHFKLSRIKEIVAENKHFIIPEILDNLGQDAQVVWSLFLVITALSVLDIGVLGVVSSLIGIIITHITGKFIDQSDKKKIVRFGAVATTITWFLSYLIAVYSPTPLLLYVITMLRGFSLGIFASAYGVIMLNRARQSDAQFIVLREIPTVFGRLFIFTMTLIFISYNKIELSFLMVSILSIYFWFNNLDVLTHKNSDNLLIENKL